MVSGAVNIQRDTERLDGMFGQRLRAGDIVATGGDGSAAIMFASGYLIEIGESSRMTIRDIGGVSTRPEGGTVITQVSSDVAGQLTRYAQRASGGGGPMALPPMRSSDGKRIELLTPRRTTIVNRTPTFRWTEIADALEYRVHLSGDGRASGSHRASEARWTLPAELAFGAHQTWTWNVEALTPDGTLHSESVPFDVASDSLTQIVHAMAGRMKPLLESDDPPRGDSARYMLATTFRNLGLYSDAIEQYEILISRHPRAELHQELGELYRVVGRYEEAALEYRRALAR
jgi:hypothetical protein